MQPAREPRSIRNLTVPGLGRIAERVSRRQDVVALVTALTRASPKSSV